MRGALVRDEVKGLSCSGFLGGAGGGCGFGVWMTLERGFGGLGRSSRGIGVEWRNRGRGVGGVWGW